MTDSKGQDLRGGRLLFALAVAGLVAAAGFTGAMVRPLIDHWRNQRDVVAEGDVALVLEHAAVDIRLGRGAAVETQLASLAGQAKDAAVKDRILTLWVEAAVQAGRLAVADEVEARRESLTSDARLKRRIQLRRIGLLAALGRKDQAEALTTNVIAASTADPQLADEARLRLVSTMAPAQIEEWVKKTGNDDPEVARRAGLAALHLLGDAAQAERLLAPLRAKATRDRSLLGALLEAYVALKRHRDVVLVAEALLEGVEDEAARTRIVLVLADALAQAGEIDKGIALLEGLSRTAELITSRQQATRTRYLLLKQAGRLAQEVTALEKKGNSAARAYVALEIERDFGGAEKLYGELLNGDPASAVFEQGFREAQRRKGLAEEMALYQKVLEKDPGDQGAIEKLLATAVALGETELAQRLVSNLLERREKDPQVLLSVSALLTRAGLLQDALGLLNRAYAVEPDVAKKQQILVLVGDLYANARQEENAHRVYAGLAMEGVSPEIREQALARLAAILRIGERNER